MSTATALANARVGLRNVIAPAINAGVPEDALTDEFNAVLADLRVPVESPAVPWPELTNAGAVERALREATEPLKVQDITRVLDQNGRGDSGLDVSAALGYLKKNGRARSPRYGFWEICPEA